MRFSFHWAGQGRLETREFPTANLVDAVRAEVHLLIAHAGPVSEVQ